jgi:hypothetical protein
MVHLQVRGVVPPPGDGLVQQRDGAPGALFPGRQAGGFLAAVRSQGEVAGSVVQRAGVRVLRQPLDFLERRVQLPRRRAAVGSVHAKSGAPAPARVARPCPSLPRPRRGASGRREPVPGPHARCGGSAGAWHRLAPVAARSPGWRWLSRTIPGRAGGGLAWR